MTLPAISAARDILEHAMTHDERSLQTRIGPSELGTTCMRCLVRKLAGTPSREDTPWLPSLGRAFHAWAEQAMHDHAITTGSDDWLPEARVTVGDIAGQPVTGTCDLMHVPTGTIIDFKLVGSTTLKKVGADGAGCPQIYKVQAHLYGAGYVNRGLQVRTVAVWFLPRNAMSLSSSRVWSAPYNPSVAAWALERATKTTHMLTSLGTDQTLTLVGPHNGDEFSCRTFPDFTPQAGVQDAATFLGVA